ncbi:helix-turn-helix transcriptional regulator [Amycolatopsis sp. WAC 04169]|uniref:helix-turn-helix transcriptional regulator n=1 Tax=Amycolatopsis sp. WAC 04169 TaxID=2203197 RepID=UPI000F7B6170|nr:helix-turn-helix transcriptional regulator [Amycolatopsis sp. WAC 04169]
MQGEREDEMFEEAGSKEPVAGPVDPVGAVRTELERLVADGRWYLAGHLVRMLSAQHSLSRPVTGYAQLVHIAGARFLAGLEQDGSRHAGRESKEVLRVVQALNRGRQRGEVVRLARAPLTSEHLPGPARIWVGVLALAYAGHLADARALLRLAEDTRGAHGTAVTRSGLALLRARVASWGAGREAAAEAMKEILTGRIPAELRSLTVAWTVSASVAAGEFSRARALLREHDFDGPLTDVADEAELLFARGGLHLATGKHELGYDDYKACGRLLLSRSVHNPAVLPWRAHAALCSHVLQRPVLAASLASASVIAARRWGARETLAISLYASSTIAADRDGAPRRDEHGDFGGVVLRPEFTAVLNDLCGVTEHAPLTDPEREVTELARAGLRNKEIAERLSVSTRTVEARLSKVYRKLGVTGRDGLRGIFTL